MKNKMTVLDLLSLMESERKVKVFYYAYGIAATTSADSGETVEELLSNLKYDCLHANIANVFAEENVLIICAIIR